MTFLLHLFKIIFGFPKLNHSLILQLLKLHSEGKRENVHLKLLIKRLLCLLAPEHQVDRKSTRLNSSHANISYAVFCLKKKKNKKEKKQKKKEKKKQKNLTYQLMRTIIYHT